MLADPELSPANEQRLPPQGEILDASQVIQHWLAKIGDAIDGVRSAYQHPDLSDHVGPEGELNELRYRYAVLSRRVVENLESMDRAVKASFELMTEVDNDTRRTLRSLSQESTRVETTIARGTISSALAG